VQPRYSISLKTISPDFPSNVTLLLYQARLRWESIITTPLPSFAYLSGGSYGCAGEPGTLVLHKTKIRDLLVFFDIAHIDGPGGVIGQAGPCSFDSQGMPRVGILRLDSSDMDKYLNNGLLLDVILHEFAHILGFGTLWTGDHLVDTLATPYLYLGANGILGMDLVGGGTNNRPIVEDTGGDGTALAHWKESIYQTELMTGYINLGTNPLSKLTLEALRDLNYGVDLAQANSYTVPSQGTVVIAAAVLTAGETKAEEQKKEGVHLKGCIWSGKKQVLKDAPK